MSITIKAYIATKLTNNYKLVFSSTPILRNYLNTCSVYTLYSGDDVYFTKTGTISADNTSLLNRYIDRCNYLEFYDSETSKYRYAFITNVQIVDSIAIIAYDEDVWHNYACASSDTSYNFTLTHSITDIIKDVYISSSTISSNDYMSVPKKLIVEREGQKYFNFTTYDSPFYCYVLATISFYKLTGSGKISQRTISSYLLSHQAYATSGYTPASTAKLYIWEIKNTTLDCISGIVAISSNTQVYNRRADGGSTQNWYYEILDVKLIPKNVGDSWFSDILTGDDTHTGGIYQNSEVQTTFPAITTSLSNVYYFDTIVGFNDIVLDYSTRTQISGEWIYTYNGFDSQINDSIKHSFALPYKDLSCIAIGNKTRMIPIEYAGNVLSNYNSALLILNVNMYSTNIQLNVNNTLYDVTEDFTLELPISTQDASTTQQQYIARRSANIASMIGMTTGAINTGAQIGQAISGAGSSGTASSIMSGISHLAIEGVNMDARNSAMYLSNKAMLTHNNAFDNALLGGFAKITMHYTNEYLVNQAINQYGYKQSFIIDNPATFTFTGNYVKFKEAHVHGAFPNDIREKIEQILMNGISFTDAPLA